MPAAPAPAGRVSSCERAAAVKVPTYVPKVGPCDGEAVVGGERGAQVADRQSAVAAAPVPADRPSRA